MSASKIASWVIVGGSLAAIAYGIAGQFFEPDAPAPTAVSGPTRPPGPPIRQNVVLRASTPSRGAREPLVVAVLWCDLESPACRAAARTVGELLRARSSLLLTQFRHLPTTPSGERAARMTAAAALVDRFWAMHDRVLAHDGPLDDATLDRLASDVSLDVARLHADASGEVVGRVLAEDREDAARYGVTHVPALFMNGIPVADPTDRAALERIIDAEIVVARRYVADGIRSEDVYKALVATEAGKPWIAPTTTSTTSSKLATTATTSATLSSGAPPRFGAQDAKVEVTAFVDFEAPSCDHLLPQLARLEATLGHRVAFTWVLSPGRNAAAELAARAALAAHRQGKLRAMATELCAHRDAWTTDGVPRLAHAAKLDDAQFARDLVDPAIRAALRAQIETGVRAGVSVRPTLRIEGQFLEGPKKDAEIRKVVDAALAAK